MFGCMYWSSLGRVALPVPLEPNWVYKTQAWCSEELFVLCLPSTPSLSDPHLPTAQSPHQRTTHNPARQLQEAQSPCYLLNREVLQTEFSARFSSSKGPRQISASTVFKVIWTIFNGWTKWKSWKFAFLRNARIHGSRHRAGNCCHATPWRQQPRTAQARGAWMTRQHTEDRQLYNQTFPTSRAHRGSLSKRRELVLSSLPTRPPLFLPSLGPQSLTLRVSFPCICSPPVCIICSVTSLSLATTTWTPEHPFFSTHCYPNASSDITCVLGGGSFPVTSHGISSKGVAAARARRLFPSTISGVRAQFLSYLWVEN